MNKVYGLINDFVPIRSERIRNVVSYAFTPVGDGVHALWNEIYLYKKQDPDMSYKSIRNYILNDIDTETKRRITEEMRWNDHMVWLSIENQQNYKTALDMAVETDGSNLPVRLRLGTTDEPHYEVFETIESLKEFWVSCSNHISECLRAGWALKDSVQWEHFK